MTVETARSKASRTDAEPPSQRPPSAGPLRRRVTIVLCLVALLVVLRLWWGWQAGRRLSAEVAAIRARGEPVLLADFDPPAVDPAVDAVAAFARAATSLAPLTPLESMFDTNFEGLLPLTPGEQTVLRGILAKDGPALSAARRARAMPGWAGGTRLQSPVITQTLPLLHPQRQLAVRLQWLALASHAAGEDAEVVEAALDGLALGRAVQQDTPFVVSYLVAAGADHLVADALGQATPALAIDGDTAPVPSTRPAGAASAATTAAARPDRVRELVAALLDDAPARAAFVRSFHASRATHLDSVRLFEDQYPAPLGALLRPSLELSAVRLMQWDDATVRAAAQPNYPAALRLVPTRTRNWANRSRVEQTAWVMEENLSYSAAHAVLTHHRRLTSRRLAAVALAVRLYRADHAGAYPPSLDALVPAYLPAVPVDPFSPDGKPLGYNPAAPVPAGVAGNVGGTEPVLYSVGDDGFDSGGSWVPRRPVRSRWDAMDVVQPLARQPESRPTATPPVLPPATGNGGVVQGSTAVPTTTTTQANGPATAPSSEAQDDDRDERRGAGGDQQ